MVNELNVAEEVGGEKMTGVDVRAVIVKRRINQRKVEMMMRVEKRQGKWIVSCVWCVVAIWVTWKKWKLQLECQT